MANEAPQPVNEALQSVTVKIPAGLSAQEAKQRLAQYGPNEVAEKKTHPVAGFLGKFWAPVPWMLEATVADAASDGRSGYD